MTTLQIEIRAYPSESKVSLDELDSEGAASLMDECKQMLSDLEDVMRR